MEKVIITFNSFPPEYKTETVDHAGSFLKTFTLESTHLKVSDGYHTFDELYEHRIELFITLCRLISRMSNGKSSAVWRSKLHSDGSSFDGWFILGSGKSVGDQITYHLPMSKWPETEFAETLEMAPQWDGHQSLDVLERLKYL